jgi:hypothetical protein
MPICSNCGVEIENEYEHCPLCGVLLTGETDEEPPLGGEYSEVIEQHDEKVRLLFRDIFTFIALAGAVVVFAVDFAYGMNISWARYPLASIAFLWLAVFLISALKRRVYLLVLCETAATALFLYLVDLFSAASAWFLPLALPLTLAAGALVTVTIAVIRRFDLSALGGISAGLISAGLYTVCAELLINAYLGRPLQPSWSLITAAAVIPIIAFLIHFVKRLERRGSNLEKYLHV